MKKVLPLLLAVMLLWLAVPGFAAAEQDAKELNAGEIAAAAFSAVVGEGRVIPLNRTLSYDDIDSRMVILGQPTLGSDLAVCIRVSETQAVLWALDLNSDNLRLVRSLLTEDAPLCLVILYDKGKEKDSALYVRGTGWFAFNAFQADADRVFGLVRLPDEKAPDSAGADPFLSEFPGLDWSMGKEQILSKYSDLHWTDVSSSLMHTAKIDGSLVTYLLMFQDDSLWQIMVSFPDDKVAYYTDRYTALYGTPVRTDLGRALIGMPVESVTGDTLLWKTGDIYVALRDNTVFCFRAK